MQEPVLVELYEVQPEPEVCVTQDQVVRLQELLEAGPTLEPVEEHYFADGVYARVIKVPAGATIVGKAHRTEHISILMKGKITVTSDDGNLVTMEAPAIYVVPAGKKKAAYVIEEMWFVNIHPTDTTDLEVIESRVIIPEVEYKNILEARKQERIAQGV